MSQNQESVDHIHTPVVLCMGSKSDWKILKPCYEILGEFEIQTQVRILSAHRTPEYMLKSAKEFESLNVKVIIAAAGGAAHLPGMMASNTILPVIGVPVLSRNSIFGIDSLLSIVQMPAGVPVATMAINGAQNAALMAVSILAISDKIVAKKFREYKERLKDKVKWQQEELDKELLN